MKIEVIKISDMGGSIRNTFVHRFLVTYKRENLAYNQYWITARDELHAYQSFKDEWEMRGREVTFAIEEDL
jgi:hypothetical protein